MYRRWLSQVLSRTQGAPRKDAYRFSTTATLSDQTLLFGRCEHHGGFRS